MISNNEAIELYHRVAQACQILSDANLETTEEMPEVEKAIVNSLMALHDAKFAIMYYLKKQEMSQEIVKPSE